MSTSTRQVISGLATLGMLLSYSIAQAADANTEVDTSGWVCQWCPVNQQARLVGDAELGVGYVSNDSYKQGDYVGSNEEGAYLLGRANLQMNGDDARYLQIEVDDLGLDSRYLDVQGGFQGLVDMQLLYDQLPKLNSDTSRSPYSGGTVLDLPAGWVDGATTSNMSELNAALRQTDLYTERKKQLFSATIHQSPKLSYDFSYQQETKQGTKSFGAAIGSVFATARSVLLPATVDQVTERTEAGVNYLGRQFNASLRYALSNFDNNVDAIRWDNPFSTPAGIDEGQTSSEPDNSMQQISLSGSYRLPAWGTLAAFLAYGKMTQDQAFLPYTISNIASASLTRNSLDGEIDTFDANLGYRKAINAQLDIKAGYVQHEQDNQTARDNYQSIIADTAAGAVRSNVPYGYRQRKWDVNGQYRLSEIQSFELGFANDSFDRSYQDVDNTAEQTVWGKYRIKPAPTLDVQLRLATSDREGDAYQPFSEVSPPENALMEKYNLADRSRDKLSLALFYEPIVKLSLGFNVDRLMDDYSNSDLGLQGSEQLDISADAGYQVNELMSVHAVLAQTHIKSDQAGSQSVAAADWWAQNDERMNLLSLGLQFRSLRFKVSGGADYTYANVVAETQYTGADNLPDYTSKRHTFRLYGDYELSKRAALSLLFHYEEYDEENWAVDDVSPTTIPHVLTMGDTSPSYAIGVVWLGYKYKF